MPQITHNQIMANVEAEKKGYQDHAEYLRLNSPTSVNPNDPVYTALYGNDWLNSRFKGGRSKTSQKSYKKTYKKSRAHKKRKPKSYKKRKSRSYRKYNKSRR